MEEGAIIKPNGLIDHIPDMSEMKMKITIPESKINKLKVGQRASVRLDVHGSDGNPHVGQVTRISNFPSSSWQNQARTYDVFVALERADQNWKIGLTGIVGIQVGE